MDIAYVDELMQPEEGVVQVTVQFPTVLAAALIAPVLELIDKPAGVLLNVPPLTPLMVGVMAPVKLLQQLENGQLNAAEGKAVTLIEMAFETVLEQPDIPHETDAPFIGLLYVNEVLPKLEV